MGEQDNGQVATATTPQRPTTDDPKEWKAYWKAQGWSWRTESEIDEERQKYLAERRNTPPDIQKGIYPFGGIKLNRADMEWLLVTHENGRGPVDWKDEKQRGREGLDLRGAELSGNLERLPLTRLRGGLSFFERSGLTEDQEKAAMVEMDGVDLAEAHLEGAILSGVTFKHVFLRKAHLQKADLSESKLLNVKMSYTQFAGANLSSIQLENVHFSSARLMEANLSEAQLTYVNLRDANLARANLSHARLKKVDLHYASLEGAYLTGARLEEVDLEQVHLKGANFSEAQLEAVNLRGVTLNDEHHIGPLLADVQWERTNLTVVDWSQVKILGDEHVAYQKNSKDGDYIGLKSKDVRLREYQVAVRANRQFATVLQSQGLNEDAARFAYRAQLCQRIVLRYQKKFRQYLFSGFLDLLAGYGYRPGRSVLWYLAGIFGFALAYFAIGHLPFFPDAFVFSLTSFHGRGFFPGLGSENSLHNPLVILAAFEAVIGLLIEISFIATFTQRFFGR